MFPNTVKNLTEVNTVPDFKLIDRNHRKLNYLRISITDRCNLRCLYCVPEGRIPKLSHNAILSYEEILRIVNIATRLGVNKVRVTGGEPLVRKGVYRFLSQLTELDALNDVSLTTNAVLLEKNAQKIFDAGIRRINISLDTLKKEKYHQITGYNLYDRAWNGIRKALELGFNPIKINVVALKGINEDEIIDFGKLSTSSPFHIRFIEYMPIGASRANMDQHLLTPEIKHKLSAVGRLVRVENGTNDGPAQRYKFEGGIGEIGFISAVSRHFCNTCNRMRLTADGNLRACLLSDSHTNLKNPLRAGCSDDKLKELFLAAVQSKSPGHNLSPELSKTVNGRMYGIGG